MAEVGASSQGLRIDLGCGNARRTGFVGLDVFPGEQVDHVIDLTTDRYPFDDDTVDEVFSAHFLEHIDEPNHVFSEIGRVCRDGARIEFWTPYAWTNEAFLYGHLHGVTEDLWSQFCIHHRDQYASMLGGRWLLRRVVYVLEERTIGDLRAYGVSLDFAVKYLKGVVKEMGVEMELRRDLSTPAAIPERLFASSRTGPRSSLDATRPWLVGMRGRAHRASYLVRRAALEARDRLR
jgi:SAM-dependent methyltransferase